MTGVESGMRRRPDHWITGRITLATEMNGPEHDDWISHGIVEPGPWGCSCGKEFETASEAARHYRETRNRD